VVVSEVNASVSHRPEEIGFSVESRWPEAKVAVVTPVGEVDVYTAVDLEAELGRAIDRGAELVVVEMKDTSFVDSVALGVLLRTLRLLEQRGGELRIASAHPNVMRALEITLLDRVLPIYPNCDAALAGFPGER